MVVCWVQVGCLGRRVSGGESQCGRGGKGRARRCTDAAVGTVVVDVQVVVSEDKSVDWDCVHSHAVGLAAAAAVQAVATAAADLVELDEGTLGTARTVACAVQQILAVAAVMAILFQSFGHTVVLNIAIDE